MILTTAIECVIMMLIFFFIVAYPWANPAHHGHQHGLVKRAQPEEHGSHGHPHKNTTHHDHVINTRDVSLGDLDRVSESGENETLDDDNSSPVFEAAWAETLIIVILTTVIGV
jgi:hypothetical protein